VLRPVTNDDAMPSSSDFEAHEFQLEAATRRAVGATAPGSTPPVPLALRLPDICRVGRLVRILGRGACVSYRIGMQGILLLAILTVKGSYADNIELPLESPTDVPDTVQWWIAAMGTWRIRTFAVDHDIHTYRVGYADDMLVVAEATNQRNYGDITKVECTLRFADCRDQLDVQARFSEVGLTPRLEIAGEDFTKTDPRVE